VVGEARYTRAELAAASGVPEDEARRLWRAMGFPDARDDERIFTDLDLQTLGSAHRLVDSGAVEQATLLQLTRVIGQSAARMAESEVHVVAERLAGVMQAEGVEPAELTGAVVNFVSALADELERYITYGWRRHLLAALARESVGVVEAREGGISLTVGFADLVGFTAFSQEADETTLATVVDRFEEIAYDRIAAFGGRVVKMIGDEVFFAVDDPVTAAEVGLELAATYSADEAVPDVRVGLALGPVIVREGDLLGPAVNLASRLVNIARPGTVLVSAELADLLGEVPAFSLRQLRRVRTLKGIGRVPVYTLRRR